MLDYIVMQMKKLTVKIIFGCCVTNTHDDYTTSPEIDKLI